jgi:DsbC/DsbD-like thiol-disulfide interchange protein
MDAQRKALNALFVLISFAAAVFSIDGPALARPALAPQAVAELIDGGLQSGLRYAGLRIRLPGEALTYWRDPGEAGVAPVFDFSASENLERAEPLFPLPQRFEEGGAQAIGYRHEVVFPLRLVARDAAKTIGLAVAVDYAVCDRLCLPMHAVLRLDLAPAGEAAPGFDAALAATPRRLAPKETEVFAQATRVSEGGAKLQWRLRLLDLGRDLFVEAPPGFFFESQGHGGDFLLTLAEHPAEKNVPDAPLRLTLAGEPPVEFWLSLK